MSVLSEVTKTVSFFRTCSSIHQFHFSFFFLHRSELKRLKRFSNDQSYFCNDKFSATKRNGVRKVNVAKMICKQEWVD